MDYEFLFHSLNFSQWKEKYENSWIKNQTLKMNKPMKKKPFENDGCLWIHTSPEYFDWFQSKNFYNGGLSCRTTGILRENEFPKFWKNWINFQKLHENWFLCKLAIWSSRTQAAEKERDYSAVEWDLSSFVQKSIFTFGQVNWRNEKFEYKLISKNFKRFKLWILKLRNNFRGKVI